MSVVSHLSNAGVKSGNRGISKMQSLSVARSVFLRELLFNCNLLLHEQQFVLVVR